MSNGEAKGRFLNLEQALTETQDRKIRAEFVDMSLDELDPGDVVVRVAYSDVNYKDALAATGKGKILRRSSCVGGSTSQNVKVKSNGVCVIAQKFA